MTKTVKSKVDRSKVVGKVVEMEQHRSGHELKLKDARARALREALRAARQREPSKQESTQKLLAIFKHKPSPKS